MSSVNKHLDPPASIALGFRSPTLETANTLQSGSAILLRPLGFTVTAIGASYSYSIVIPITDAEGEFSEVVTTPTPMKKLEQNVSQTVTPALRAAWTSAGSADPVSDSQPDVDPKYTAAS